MLVRIDCQMAHNFTALFLAVKFVCGNTSQILAHSKLDKFCYYVTSFYHGHAQALNGMKECT